MQSWQKQPSSVWKNATNYNINIAVLVSGV